MPADDMVILVRVYDLLDWLLPQAEKFPAAQRFVFTRRLTDAAFDCIEVLYLANAHTRRQRLDYLRTADAKLNTLRLYLRLAHRRHYLTDGQYQHVSVMVAEIGRLLGGWLRQTEKNTRDHDSPPA